MKDIIGHYELSSVCHSFMDSWGEFNHDEEGKCKLADNKEYNQKLYHFSGFTKNDVNLVKLIFGLDIPKVIAKVFITCSKKKH